MIWLMQHPWLLFLLTALVSAGVCGLLIPLAAPLGWMDHPDARKRHKRVTPLIGGAAIFIAMVMALWLAPVNEWSAELFYPAVLLGGFVLLLTGLIDDMRHLSALIRLLVEAGACLWLIRYTGLRLDDFGPLFTANALDLGWLAEPITVFAALGVINAFNLIDGADGIAGSIYVLAAGAMAAFAGWNGDSAMSVFLGVTSAAVIGFLVFNARLPWNRRARTFLGDSGSLLLGFVLAWGFIRLGSGPNRAFMPMTAVWLFAVPLLDTSTLIWSRWREGRSAASADQHHLHHALLRAGFTVGQTWGLISLFALALGGIGVLFQFSGLPGYLSFYSFIALAFVYYLYIKHSWASRVFLGHRFVRANLELDEGLVPMVLLKP